MDRRMIILLLILGILVFTIRLSEDTVYDPVTSVTPMGGTDGEADTSATFAQLPQTDSAASHHDSSLTGVSEKRPIRVVLSRNHGGNILADEITVSWNKDMTAGQQVYAPGSMDCSAANIPEEGLCLQTEGEFTVSFDGHEDARTFTGKLYLYSQEQKVYAVNEISLEEYVACVIPGEMPAYYPEEALKAQAVCARTYALRHLDGEEAYHADLGDTTSWQVFNSVGRSEKTDQAAAETKGEVIFTDGVPAQLYFFSTSFGFTGVDDVWNTSQISPCLISAYVGTGSKSLSTEEDFAAYITSSDDTAFEKEQAWFRWQITYTADDLTRLCRGQDDAVEEVTDIRVTQRASGFAATELTVDCGEKGTLTISGEYNIREFFSPKGKDLTNQKETRTDKTALPSGYFVIEKQREQGKLTAITLYGGGFGHGVGMSQNGARCMAEAGMTYTEILSAFFDIS